MFSEIGPATRLSLSDRRTLYELLERHYEHVSWMQFEADVAEKDAVIVLRDASGLACGFSTQKVMHVTVDGLAVRAIFSGDTIIDPSHWGEQELGRAWCRYVGQVRAADPEPPLYWFLISKGYRTYLYLPVFFKKYYPACAWPTPPGSQAAGHRIARCAALRKTRRLHRLRCWIGCCVPMHPPRMAEGLDSAGCVLRETFKGLFPSWATMIFGPGSNASRRARSG